MSTYEVQWKDGPIQIDIPDKNLKVDLKTPELPDLGEPQDLIAKAIENPIGCPPLKDQLKSGDKVALLTADFLDSRFGPEGNLGSFFLDTLNSYGIPDNDIMLVHASGMHGHLAAQHKFGPDLLNRVGTYVEHQPADDSTLTFCGVTPQSTGVWVDKQVAEADFIMGVGGCGPSLYGYQGGGGIILPGCAGRETVRYNHSFLMHPKVFLGWEDNPMKHDVHDAADMAGLKFKIDFAANNVFAGYQRDEWAVAVDYVKKNGMTPMEPTDLYIFAPDVSESLLSMYMQIEAAYQATREDGVIIAIISGSAHPKLGHRPVEQALQDQVVATEAWMNYSGDLTEADAEHSRRDNHAKLELMKLPFEQICKLIQTRTGEPRSVAHVWSHKRAIEGRKTFLVTEGITEEEAEQFGFAYTTNSFDDALSKAFRELDKDAEIAVSLPPDGGFALIDQ